jgi:hypothetical protein
MLDAVSAGNYLSLSNNSATIISMLCFFKDPQNLALSCCQSTIIKKSSKLPRFGSKESLSKILRSCTPESIGFPKTALQRGKFQVPLSELNHSDASPDQMPVLALGNQQPTPRYVSLTNL